MRRMSRTAPGGSASGSAPSYFHDSPVSNFAADVLGDRDGAAQLDVVLGVVGVQDGDAGARVAEQVAVLAPALERREQHVVALAADPHRRRLRPAVRVDRRQHGVVAAVEQPARLLVECEGHAAG